MKRTYNGLENSPTALLIALQSNPEREHKYMLLKAYKRALKRLRH